MSRPPVEGGNQTTRLSTAETDRRARGVKQIQGVFGVRRRALSEADAAELLDALGLSGVAERVDQARGDRP